MASRGFGGFRGATRIGTDARDCESPSAATAPAEKHGAVSTASQHTGGVAVADEQALHEGAPPPSAFVHCIKQLPKRDAKTRTKALMSIAADLTSPETSGDDVKALVPHFAAFYRRLAVDVDRQVRAAAANVMAAIAKELKRALTPHLKSLLPYWWLQCHDADRETAQAATCALEQTFPNERKRAYALRFALPPLAAALTGLWLSPCGLNSGMNAKHIDSAEELGLHETTVRASVLRALGALAAAVSSPPDALLALESKCELSDGQTLVGDGAPIHGVSVATIVRSANVLAKKFGGGLHSTNADVRFALYDYIASCCKHIPSQPSSSTFITDELVSSLFDSLQIEREVAHNHASLWSALLNAVKVVAAQDRTHVATLYHNKLHKKLLLFVSKMSSSFDSLTAILPLLALLLGTDGEGTVHATTRSLVELIAAIFEVQANASTPVDKSAVAEAYVECAAYVAVRMAMQVPDDLGSFFQDAIATPLLRTGDDEKVQPASPDYAAGVAASFMASIADSAEANRILPLYTQIMVACLESMSDARLALAAAVTSKIYRALSEKSGEAAANATSMYGAIARKIATRLASLAVAGSSRKAELNEALALLVESAGPSCLIASADAKQASARAKEKGGAVSETVASILGDDLMQWLMKQLQPTSTSDGIGKDDEDSASNMSFVRLICKCVSQSVDSVNALVTLCLNSADEVVDRVRAKMLLRRIVDVLQSDESIDVELWRASCIAEMVIAHDSSDLAIVCLGGLSGNPIVHSDGAERLLRQLFPEDGTNVRVESIAPVFNLRIWALAQQAPMLRSVLERCIHDIHFILLARQDTLGVTADRTHPLRAFYKHVRNASEFALERRHISHAISQSITEMCDDDATSAVSYDAFVEVLQSLCSTAQEQDELVRHACSSDSRRVTNANGGGKKIQFLFGREPYTSNQRGAFLRRSTFMTSLMCSLGPDAFLAAQTSPLHTALQLLCADCIAAHARHAREEEKCELHVYDDDDDDDDVRALLALDSPSSILLPYLLQASQDTSALAMDAFLAHAMIIWQSESRALSSDSTALDVNHPIVSVLECVFAFESLDDKRWGKTIRDFAKRHIIAVDASHVENGIPHEVAIRLLPFVSNAMWREEPSAIVPYANTFVELATREASKGRPTAELAQALDVVLSVYPIKRAEEGRAAAHHVLHNQHSSNLLSLVSELHSATLKVLAGVAAARRFESTSTSSTDMDNDPTCIFSMGSLSILRVITAALSYTSPEKWNSEVVKIAIQHVQEALSRTVVRFEEQAELLASESEERAHDLVDGNKHADSIQLSCTLAVFVLEVLFELERSGQPAPLSEGEFRSSKDDLVGELLRLCFAAGFVLSATRQQFGEDVNEAERGVGQWFGGSRSAPLWRSVCRATLYCTNAQVSSASQAASIWGEDLGISSVQALMGMLVHESARADERQALRNVAFELLLSYPLHSACALSDSADLPETEEEMQMMLELGATAAQMAGIREKLDALLAQARREGTQSGMSTFLVGMILLLNCMRETSLSPNEERMRVLHRLHHYTSSTDLLQTALNYTSKQLNLTSFDVKPKRKPGGFVSSMNDSSPSALDGASMARLRRLDRASLTLRDDLVIPITFWGNNELQAHEQLCHQFIALALTCCSTISRQWFASIRDRSLIAGIESYVAKHHTAKAVELELDTAAQRGIGSSGGDRAISIQPIKVQRILVAKCELDDESTLVINIKFPSTFPLQAPDAECVERVGVSEGKLRKWLLTTNIYLRNASTGGCVEALLRWKEAVDKEFDGLEPCPICYSVVHATSRLLPKLQCRQCANKYHSACLYQWFTKSQKSMCPMCQVPWGTVTSRPRQRQQQQQQQQHQQQQQQHHEQPPQEQWQQEHVGEIAAAAAAAAAAEPQQHVDQLPPTSRVEEDDVDEEEDEEQPDLD